MNEFNLIKEIIYSNELRVVSGFEVRNNPKIEFLRNHLMKEKFTINLGELAKLLAE